MSKQSYRQQIQQIADAIGVIVEGDADLTGGYAYALKMLDDWLASPLRRTRRQTVLLEIRVRSVGRGIEQYRDAACDVADRIAAVVSIYPHCGAGGDHA